MRPTLVHYKYIFFTFFGEHESFCGATDTPCFGLLVTSPLVFKARMGSALFALGRGVCVAHSLRFTSGATPAHLLAASMAA